jgi:trk system potassium uptake protein TrkH
MVRFTQNINFPIVLRVIGWLLMIEAAFMIVPIGISLCYGENGDIMTFVYSIAITAATGAIMTFGIRPKSMAMRTRDGLLLTSITWIFFSFFGMLPYIFSGTLTNPADAFFETMSGFTTTGSTMIINVDGTSHGILFWRALTQWVGGMGIILFTLAVLPMLNYKGGITLFNAEVSGLTHRRMKPRINQTAKDLWIIYIVLSVAMTLMLVKPMGWFDSVCHTMAALSTGGFSTKTMGVRYWNSYYVDLVITVFMFLGGVNFPLMYSVSKGRFNVLKRSDTFKWYCLVILFFTVIIILRTWYAGYFEKWSDRVILTLFDTVSAITSTGFTVMNYEKGGEFISMLLMVSMFFGGMAGSTAGGAKIDRMIVLIKNTKNELYRMLHPNAVMTVRVDGAVVSHDMISKVLAFLTVYTTVLVVVALILNMDGAPLTDAIFTSMSSLSNIGMGYGVTGQTGSFAYFPDYIKWILSFEMLVGRLELFTFMIIFTRGFWSKE